MTRRKNNGGVWWAPYAWGTVFVGATAWGIDRTGSFWSGVVVGVLIVLLIMALLLLGDLLFTAEGRKIVADAERRNHASKASRSVMIYDESDDCDDMDDERLYPDGQTWDPAAGRWTDWDETEHRHGYCRNMDDDTEEPITDTDEMLNPDGQTWDSTKGRWVDDPIGYRR